MSLHKLSVPPPLRAAAATTLVPKDITKSGPVADYLCGILEGARHGRNHGPLRGTIATFPAGRTISRVGDPASSAIILSGWASQQRISFKGSRQIFSFLTPGEFLGLGATANGAACADVIAVTQVTAITVSTVGSLNGEMLKLKLLAARKTGQARATARLYDSIVLLGLCTAYERLAYLLVDTFDRLAEVGLVTNHGIQFPLTQETIGDALGISSVHVNRTLQQLRQQRLCEIAAGRLIIPNTSGIYNVTNGIRRRSMEITGQTPSVTQLLSLR